MPGSKSCQKRKHRACPGAVNTGPGGWASLTEPGFRLFFCGYATSLLGSAMATVALIFAVLRSGGTPADLGLVFSAAVVPQVVFMLGGGVLADRIGRRPVMLGTDAGRLLIQAGLAIALFAGRPPVWLFIAASALRATGDAFFGPALGGLPPDLVPERRLADANALLSTASSAASIAGPALAGLLIAVTGPATVIAVDAGTFAVSLAALALLRVPPATPSARTPWRDLADGWAQFRAHAWLWVTTLQFALFNLISWAPYLLLGPILARQYLGGARAWGIIMSAYAAGSVLAGLAASGRRPRRPMVVAVTGTFGYAAPCLALALHAPLFVVAAGAAAAGAGTTVFGVYEVTIMQHTVPREMLSRTTAFQLTGAYALGSLGYAVIGPLAGVAGARTLLAVAAGYALLSSTAVLCVPAIRAVRWPATADSGPDTSGPGPGTADPGPAANRPGSPLPDRPRSREDGTAEAGETARAAGRQA